MIWFIIIVVVLILVSGLRVVNEYERAVLLTLGKYSGILKPGLRLIIPVVQNIYRVDMRVKAVDVPEQESITKDNITVGINAVIYYKVASAEKAILEVEDFMYAIKQLAQTSMRNIVGEVELDDLLSKRESISEQIRHIVDAATDSWGIKVSSVELKDITLPADMKRVIGKQAEAEREKRSVIIKAEGEFAAAKNMAEAAKLLAKSEGALHLRTLQTLNGLGGDKSNTIVFAIPLEILQAMNRK